mgnify:CR=1 FL=1
MIFYPVIIPTLNRYQHFKECVESLAACTHADKTELVIGLDYPPSEKYVEGWKQIKEYLPTIKGFGKVTIFEHDHNLGASGNPLFLKKYIFEHYDAYIFTEDDNVFSPCFLDFMDKCLEKYKEDPNVMLVSGCLEPTMQRLLSDETSDNTIIKVIGNNSAYGMGLWKAKELKLQISFPSDFKKYVFSSRKRIIKLLQCPAKLNHIYFWIKAKPELNRLCDFTRNAWAVLYHQMNILPVISLVRNNGFDGTGENCGYSNEEMNVWKKMDISEEATYDIADDLSRSDIKRATKKLFGGVAKGELKSILPVIISHLLLGYHISQKIELLTDRIKARIKSKIKK